MKGALLLPLAVTAAAFIIPEESVAAQLQIEPKDGLDVWEQLSESAEHLWSAADRTFSDVVQKSHNALDEALAAASETGKKAKESIRSWTSMPSQSWFDSAVATDAIDFLEGTEDHHRDHDHDHCGRGHHGHHGHDGCKPNMTVYQLIKKSKYTTKLAKLIDEEADLVAALNSTAANYTVFAPTDHAFEKIPEHGKKPSPELIKKTLLYHVSPDYYPAGRVLISHTIPTLLKEKTLGDYPQRIRFGLGLKGLELNFYSRIIAVNVFATNGVIHGIDDVLFIPPETLDLIEYLPGEFSTLQLALLKTGLWHDFKNTAQAGGTFFAPSNFAFQKLGPKINAFLFSEHGLKYLKAILKYHVVGNQTLYSDAYYDTKSDDASTDDYGRIPKGYFHIDLPTLLGGRPVGVDIARYGGFISIKLNGFVTVTVQDGIAKDGVVHMLSNVLIPPKKIGDGDDDDHHHHDDSLRADESLSVEQLKERLAPYFARSDEL